MNIRGNTHGRASTDWTIIKSLLWFLFIETFTISGVFIQYNMDLKEKFNVLYYTDALEFLQRIEPKTREKIVYNKEN